MTSSRSRRLSIPECITLLSRYINLSPVITNLIYFMLIYETQRLSLISGASDRFLSSATVYTKKA